MSRSFKYRDGRRNQSEKADKRRWHKKLRRLLKGKEDDASVHPKDIFTVSDTWDMSKDRNG